MVEQLLSPPAFAKRFNYLLLAPELAKGMVGVHAPGIVSYAESEQSFTRRQLLKIEKDAIKNKLEVARIKADYLETINQQLHTLINKKLQQTLTDPQAVCDTLLNWSQHVTALIDLLATPSATISKVEAIAVNVPWLFDDLMRQVNQPQYRRRDVKGEVITVDTLKTALSFIGIENVKRVLPGMIYRQTLPLLSDPFPQIKHKVWEYTLISARTAETIAPLYKVRPFDAYCLALCSQLGRSAILKLYFRLFEQVHLDFLRHAQKAKLRNLHSALVQLLPDPKRIIQLIDDHADQATLHLFDFMQFRNVNFYSPLKQVINDVLPDEASSLTQVLQQSRYYAKFRMLRDNGLFLDNEEQRFIAGCAIDESTLHALATRNLTQFTILGEA